MSKTLAALAAVAALCVSSGNACALLTTWNYTGTINPAFSNPDNFPVPVGEEVEITITFDGPLVDTNSLDGVADYLFSGGQTGFQVRIGDHVGTPITKFRLTTIVENCCAADDQYNFLSYESQGSVLDVDFPGFLEGDVNTQLFFRRRHTPGPITDTTFPAVPPNPAAFFDAHIFFWKDRTSTSGSLTFSANLDPTAPVPEPGSAALGAFAILAGYRLVRRRAA